MKLIGLVRLGRDAELRFASNGDPVAGFSGAFNYGRKGQDGSQPTQWVDFALWGKRAESLAPRLTKGAAVVVCASDVHIEEFDKRDGSVGFKLTARVDDLQFASGRQEGDRSASRDAPAPAPAAARAPAPAGRSSTSFDDMDDDIPF